MKSKTPLTLSFLIFFLISVTSILKAQGNREGNHCAVTKSLYRISMDSGKVVYAGECLSCHQANGMGVLNSSPPLNGSLVTGDKKKLIEILINYHASQVEVNNVTIHYVVPPNPGMKDSDIADVLT